MSHFCPRRDDTTRWLASQQGPTFYFDPEVQIGTTPLEDDWDTRDWLNSSGLPECSYCGSLRPQDFVAALTRPDAEIHGTDKRYKAYVILPNPKAGQERVYSAITFEPREGETGWTKVTWKNRAWLKRDGWGSDHYTYLRLSPAPATIQAKFYFQHLAHPSPERAAFYDWYLGHSAVFYSGNPLGLHLEHIARHPETMTDVERKALDEFRERNPGIAAP